MNDLKTIRQLVKLMVDNDLTEVDLEQEGEKIRIARRAGAPEVQYVSQAPPPPAAAPPAAATATPSQPAEKPEAGGIAIKSPMVGTFYLSPSPDAEPYVQVGAKVGADSVVCIIEAMKVFNEIKAEVAGTVTKILVENGQSVEFDQPLFLVKTA